MTTSKESDWNLVSNFSIINRGRKSETLLIINKLYFGNKSVSVELYNHS